MFGYIRCCQGMLEEKDQALYESYYCGLCHITGKEFGQINRSFLSYDITFFALLHAMLFSQTEDSFSEIRCPVPPFSKRSISGADKSLRYAANVGTLLLYYKLEDGLLDQKGIKKVPLQLISPFFKRQRKKAAKRYPEADEICQTTMQQQVNVENAEQVSVDEAANPTAEGLGRLLENTAPPELSQKAYRVGYLLGRWVYLIDAVDDFEKDLLSENFNIWHKVLPDAVSREDILKEAGISLNRTLGALATAYQILTSGELWSVVTNVIYLGLPAVQKQVFAGNYQNKPALSKKKSDDLVEGVTSHERSI